MLKYLAVLSLIVLFLGNVLKNALDRHLEGRSKRVARILRVSYWSILIAALVLGIGKNISDVKLGEGMSLAKEGRNNLNAGLHDDSLARIEMSFKPLSRAIEILQKFSYVDRNALSAEIMARHDLALAKEDDAYSTHTKKCKYYLEKTSSSPSWSLGAQISHLARSSPISQYSVARILILIMRRFGRRQNRITIPCMTGWLIKL